MKIVIDFGTSRTAVAVADDASNYCSLPTLTPQRTLPDGGKWSLTKLIDGLTSIQHVPGRVPHLLMYSRYCQIGNIAVPISIEGTDVAFPAGCDAFPPGTAFDSLKQRREWAEPFLRAVARMVRSIVPAGAQWVIGRSAGGIDPTVLGLPGGTSAYNEAVAVLYALASLGTGDLTPNDQRFVVLADLGGGFLDVSVAHRVVVAEHDGHAEIVNYGGYPLGVDRIGLRFAKAVIDNPDALLRLVSAAIVYHIADYLERRPEPKRHGVVFLTGGGFARLKGAAETIKAELTRLRPHIQVDGVDVHPVAADTKLLTVAGLLRLAGVGDGGAGGADITRAHPNFHGRGILVPEEGMPPYETWSGLLDGYRRQAYGR